MVPFAAAVALHVLVVVPVLRARWLVLGAQHLSCLLRQLWELHQPIVRNQLTHGQMHANLARHIADHFDLARKVRGGPSRPDGLSEFAI